EQVARLQRAVGRHALRRDAVSRKLPSLDAALERVANRRVAEHAGAERRRTRQDIGRPLGELGEVVDEGRLQRRLGDVLGAGARARQRDRSGDRGGTAPPRRRATPEETRTRAHRAYSGIAAAGVRAAQSSPPETWCTNLRL